MDIQLKDEWVGKPLRQRCWPMAQNEAQEIEMQTNELLRAGLIEAFPLEKYHFFCFQHFLLTKMKLRPKEWSYNFASLIPAQNRMRHICRTWRS